MADWSIRIVDLPDGNAGFTPDVPGGAPGTPLDVRRGDLVTWNNTTDKTHQPWPANANYGPLPEDKTRGTPIYLSDPIPPGHLSSSWVATRIVSIQNTVPYVCKLHPQEHGDLRVGNGPGPGDG